MRKKFWIICIMLTCVVALAGCSQVEETTGESTGTSQVVESEVQGAISAETQETASTEGSETQENVATEVSEVQETVSTAASEPVTVVPLPVTVDMEQLDNCTIAISLNKGDVYVDDTGVVQLDVTVFVYDLYDMVDIALLKEEDVIVIREEEVKVSSLERSEDGAVIINGGLDVGGYELYTDDDTVFYERGYSDVKSYYELDEATLRVSDEFIYSDASDLDKDAVIYHAEDFLTDKNGLVYNFIPNNTTITIEDGYVIEMTRVYVP